MSVKVEVKSYTDKMDWRTFLVITATKNGEVVGKLEFSDGEPEDNSLGRNFGDCWNISKVIKALVPEAEIVTKEYETYEEFDA